MTPEPPNDTLAQTAVQVTAAQDGSRTALFVRARQQLGRLIEGT